MLISGQPPLVYGHLFSSNARYRKVFTKQQRLMEPIGGISSFVLRYHFYSLLPSSLLLWALLVHFSYSINLIFSRGTGGPNNSTLTVVLLIYQYAFKRLDMGYAAALALMLALVIMIVTLIQRYWFTEEFNWGYQVTVKRFQWVKDFIYNSCIVRNYYFSTFCWRFLPHLNRYQKLFQVEPILFNKVTLENPANFQPRTTVWLVIQ